MNRNHYVQAYTCLMLGFCTLLPVVHAVEQLVSFTVPSAQLKTLGIQTLALKSVASQNSAVQKSYPAQVVVPANAEQIISSPVAGLVLQLLVQPNQNVNRGTPLLKIASPELGQLQLQLLQAATQTSLARQAAQREQQLYAEGIIPKRRVQESDAALKQAEATLQYAKATLRMSGMSSSSITQLTQSGKMQDGVTLYASKAGVVSEIEAKVGQRVEAATDLIHITQTNNFWLDVQIPVTESANWKVGTPLQVQGHNDLTGRIQSVSPSASTSSQTVVARATLLGSYHKVRLGEFLTVKLPLAPVIGSWGLPLTAVVYQENKAFVFVRTATGFDARSVKVISSAGQNVQVQGALKAGELVAITNVIALKGAWLNPKESQ